MAHSIKRIRTLALVGHRAMVHVELKTPYGEVGPLEQRVHEVIADHNGPLCVIGFNPYSHAWFADRYPGVLRGLDSYSYAKAPQMTDAQRRSFAALEHVEIARPHFLALGLDMLPSPKAQALREAGMPVVAWTVATNRLDCCSVMSMTPGLTLILNGGSAAVVLTLTVLPQRSTTCDVDPISMPCAFSCE